MVSKRCIVLIALLAAGFLRPGAFAADSSTEHLRYDVPANAVKLGPRPTRDGNTSLRFVDPASRKLICEEVRNAKGVLIQRDLFRNDRKHGMQREWYADGKKKLEAPYRDGVMDGVFRHWDEKGNLVGCYRMQNGTGTKAIYHSSGFAREQQDFRDGLREGRFWGRFDNGKVRVMEEWIRGKLNGFAFGFHYNDGSLAYASCFRDDKRHGVFVQYDHKGQVRDLIYRIHNRVVSPEEYRKACKADASLRPYEEDPQNYRKLLTPRVRQLMDKYRRLPPVKIPLDGPVDAAAFLPQESAPAPKDVRPGAPESPAPAPARERDNRALVLGAVLVGASVILLLLLFVLRRRRTVS